MFPIPLVEEIEIKYCISNFNFPNNFCTAIININTILSPVTKLFGKLKVYNRILYSKKRNCNCRKRNYLGN